MSLEVIKTIITQKDFKSSQINISHIKQEPIEKKEEIVEKTNPCGDFIRQGFRAIFSNL